MRKFFLYVVMTVALVSCSGSDSDSGEIGGSIRFKVNGTQKVFDDIEVSQNLYFEGTPNEYTELFVVGYSNELPAEHIRFQLHKGSLEDVVSVVYFDGTNFYFRRDFAFTFNLTENGAAQRLKGTFSGTMELPDQPENNVAITQGSFNFTY